MNAALLLTVVASSLLSALATVGLLAWWLRRSLSRRLLAELEPVLHALRERVRQGTLEAGDEILPRLRSEVETGIANGIEDAVGRGLLGTAVRAGGALGGLFGRSRREPEGD